MLDNLKDLIKQSAGKDIIENSAIPGERNDEAITEASNSIFTGLQDAISKGNMSDVMNMFNGGEEAVSNSAVTQNIQDGFVQNLMHKFGLDQGKAIQIAGSLIPMVMKKFVNKTNDPNDNSFDLEKIIGSLTGAGGAVGGKDVLNNLGGTSNTSGGLVDKVKGFFD
jgi:uncharacterized protein YidB (DUF937 family)